MPKVGGPNLHKSFLYTHTNKLNIALLDGWRNGSDCGCAAVLCVAPSPHPTPPGDSHHHQHLAMGGRGQHKQFMWPGIAVNNSIIYLDRHC